LLASYFKKEEEKQYLERNVLIRLRTKDQILVRLVRCFHALLIRTHKPMTRFDVNGDLRVVNLEKKSDLECEWIADLGDFVSRPTNFDHVLPNGRFHHGRIEWHWAVAFACLMDETAG
jgi:hypothetical protein